MTPAELSRTVLCTVRRAVEAGELCVPVPARTVVRRPPRPGYGDYATNIALQLAKVSGRPPRQVAEILRSRLVEAVGVARVDIADPGFLNITLENGARQSLVQAVLAQGGAYGHAHVGRQGEDYGILRGSRQCDADGQGEEDRLGGGHLLGAVRLTFAPETRAAVTADALARILGSQGAGPVTLHCEREPDPVWAELGVTAEVTARGHGPGPDIEGPAPGLIRPVPGLIRPVPVKIPAADLLRTLGPDATRWTLLRPVAHDHPRTDPAELLVQRESNPLFRVQYAHARARALVRNAADLGVVRLRTPAQPAAGGQARTAPYSDARARAQARPAASPHDHPHNAAPVPAGGHLADPWDHLVLDDPAGPGHLAAPGHSDAIAPLLATLGDYPAVLASAARLRAPDRVARHLEAIAGAFFHFHDTCPVLPRGDEKPEAAHRARAALAQAAGTVLAGGLTLLGITAPTHL